VKAIRDAQAQETRASQTSNTPPSQAEMAQKMLAAFQTSGIDILTRDPVVEIPRVGFTTPDGAAQLSVKLSAPGLTRADLSGDPNALKIAVIRHLQGSADARIDTDLLDKLLDSTGKAENVTAQLQGLQRQGYIKLEGKALTTHITYQSGQLKVNDLPFPPMPQPPPPGAMPQGPTPPHGPAPRSTPKGTRPHP
jgi:uncharacterized protein YdgA (DUF945 family)